MAWICQLINIVGTVHVSYRPAKRDGIYSETLLIDSEGSQHRFMELPIGSMFYIPPDVDMMEWPWNLADADELADYYWENNYNRSPLFVILPGHVLFLVDGTCGYSGNKNGGWIIKGQAPKITVIPSINMKGFYHGFITNGVITNDVEGRIYKEVKMAPIDKRRKDLHTQKLVDITTRMADRGSIDLAAEVCAGNDVPFDVALRTLTRPKERRLSKIV